MASDTPRTEVDIDRIEREARRLNGDDWDSVNTTLPARHWREAIKREFARYLEAEAAAGPRDEGMTYELWDGRKLIVSVTDEDPGDMGEPRSVTEDGALILFVRAALAKADADR